MPSELFLALFSTHINPLLLGGIVKKKYGPDLITGLSLGIAIIALVVGFTAYARTSYPSPPSHDNSEDYSNSDVAPNPGYVAPNDSQESYSSGSGAPSMVDYGYIDLATGRITRVVDINGQEVFNYGYAANDQLVPFSPIGGQFTSSNVVKTTVTDPKGQQVTLNTTFQSQTQSVDPLQFVSFYNQYVAKPVNPAAPPMDYLPDLGSMVSDYAKSAIDAAIQKGAITAPVYEVVGSPLTVSDGNGATCTQETVALTNQADLQKQLDAAIGAPDLIATSIANSAGPVNVPNTDNCRVLLAQAQGKAIGGTFPPPTGFTDQGESGTDGPFGGSGSSAGDGSTSGGQVSGGSDADGTVSGSTTAGTDILCPPSRGSLTGYTCQVGGGQ